MISRDFSGFVKFLFIIIQTQYIKLLNHIIPAVKLSISGQVNISICKIPQIILCPVNCNKCQPLFLVILIHFISGCNGIVEIIVQDFPSITYPHCIFRLKFYYKLPSFIVKSEFAVRLFLYPYTSPPLLSYN